MKKVLIRLLILLVVAGVVAGGYYLVQQIPEKQDEVALAEVQKGDLVVKSHFRGELRAVRTMTLTAPNLGSQSQILALSPAGALAQKGDLIFHLDESERIASLEDDQLSVEKIHEQLKKAETDLEIRKTQDEVEIIRAAFQVQRAELEVSKNELISSIDARKNELTLEETKRRRTKLEEDIKNRLQQREAELAVLREQLKKAELDVDRERKRIEQARVLAPMTGLVSVLENRSGGRGGFGQATPTIREGDQVSPGMSVAQILDLSEMEIIAKVEEVERANLREGQDVLIRLDALPGKAVTGKVKRLGNTASTNVFRGEATKKFECILSVDMNKLLENVGASPEQVRRILASASVNAASGKAAPAPAAAGAAPAGGGGGEGRAAGGGEAGAATKKGAGGGQGRQMTPAMQKQLQAVLGDRKIEDLSQDERRQIFQQMRSAAGGGAGGGGQGGGAGGGAGGPGGGGFGGPGGGGGGGGFGGAGGGAGGGQIGAMSMSRPAAQNFTDADREKAKLPNPPSAGSDVDILLRPGLLADVEVIVESIPDTLYIPYQAVFEHPDGYIVYVKEGDRIVPRKVELGKRAESRISILSGLEEGDLIALAPPASERPATKKKKVAGGGPSFPSAGGPPGGEGGGGGGGGRKKGGGF